MPELPEVETIRRHLAPHVEGRVLTRPRGARRALVPSAGRAELAAAVRGRRVEALARRGKYLIWELEDDVHLLLHLRMTGTLLLDPPRAAAPRARALRALRRARADLRRPAPLRHGRAGARRRRARRVLRRAARRRAVLARLHQRASLRAHQRQPRARQGVPARPAQGRGRGEHLRRRGAVPRAASTRCGRAGRLTRGQVAAVRDGVVASLEAGIAAKGASIDDFRHPDGVQGSFQDRFLIHLREGEPCLVCGRAVRKLRAAGRGTYVCERCQPRPRGVRRRRGTRPGGRSGPPRRAPESRRSARRR